MAASGISQCQVLSTSGPQLLFEALGDSEFLADSPGLGGSQVGPSCSEKMTFITTGSRGVSIKDKSSIGDMKEKLEHQK